MEYTFDNANSFVGTGLDQWETGSVVNMKGLFRVAREMNANLGVRLLQALLPEPQPFRTLHPYTLKRPRIHNALSHTRHKCLWFLYTRSLTRVAHSLTSTGMGRIQGHNYAKYFRVRVEV